MACALIAILVVGGPLILWTIIEMDNTSKREQAKKELGSPLVRLRDNPGDLDTAVALQAAIRQAHFSKLKTEHSALAYQAVLD